MVERRDRVGGCPPGKIPVPVYQANNGRGFVRCYPYHCSYPSGGRGGPRAAQVATGGRRAGGRGGARGGEGGMWGAGGAEGGWIGGCAVKRETKKVMRLRLTPAAASAV